MLRGATPLLATFTLPLPLKPNWVSIQKTGWQASGLSKTTRWTINCNSTVSINDRSKRLPKHVGNAGPGPLPPFVRVERTLQLGLDWRVITQVIRLSPADSAVVLEIPLLAGELVTTPGIHVKNAKVEVNMPAQQSVMQWESTLEKSEKITISATQTEQWVEVWKADVSPIWHIEAGIAMIHLITKGNGYRNGIPGRAKQ